MSILTQLLDNQQEIKTDLSDLKQRMTILEKGSLSISSVSTNKSYNQIENEFIDLQACFEIQTNAMVEAIQKKMNRNVCQLSQELKFVSNQVGTLGRFTAKRFNDIGPAINELQVRQVSSYVPEWPNTIRLHPFKEIFWNLTSLMLHIFLVHQSLLLNSPGLKN